MNCIYFQHNILIVPIIMGIFLYIQSGRRQKKEKDVVFLGGAYLNAPPLWCVLPGTAFVFLFLFFFVAP